jgi:hypothetical protein
MRKRSSPLILTSWGISGDDSGSGKESGSGGTSEGSGSSRLKKSGRQVL